MSRQLGFQSAAQNGAFGAVSQLISEWGGLSLAADRFEA
jgi:hypothetical protein